MSEVILETRNLTKKYRNQYALKDVSISIKKNHIYGFIGENGAGKSTLIKIISGLIKSLRYCPGDPECSSAAGSEHRSEGSPYAFPQHTCLRRNCRMPDRPH